MINTPEVDTENHTNGTNTDSVGKHDSGKSFNHDVYICRYRALRARKSVKKSPNVA